MAFNEINLESIQELVDFIRRNAKHISCVVIGGGMIARIYINIIRGFHPNESIQDLIGVKVSRLNALTVASLVGPIAAYQGIPESMDDLLKIKSVLPDKVVFLGGMEVGQSTTSVACEVTEALEATSLIIGTDVDGIYTKDPKKFDDAEKLAEITLDDAMKVLDLGNTANQHAGEYRILDNVSIGIIGRSKIPVRIVKGDVESLEAAIAGMDVGTIIRPGGDKPWSENS